MTSTRKLTGLLPHKISLHTGKNRQDNHGDCRQTHIGLLLAPTFSSHGAAKLQNPSVQNKLIFMGTVIVPHEALHSVENEITLIAGHHLIRWQTQDKLVSSEWKHFMDDGADLQVTSLISGCLWSHFTQSDVTTGGRHRKTVWHFSQK